MESKTWACGDYRIYVTELNNNTHDLIVSGPNRISAGKRIENFETKEIAFKVSEVFARNFCDAVESGFHLQDNYFVHLDSRRIHISNALDTDRSQNDFKALLQNSFA